jgi:hypothetical protein
MMERKEAEKIVAGYDALLKRAADILNDEGPPWGYIGSSEFLRISFDGDDAVILEPEASSYYDSTTIETKEHRFPAALLFMADDELAAWKKRAKAEYDAQQAEQLRQRIAAQEATERRTFEALRAKFEPPR